MEIWKCIKQICYAQHSIMENTGWVKFSKLPNCCFHGNYCLFGYRNDNAIHDIFLVCLWAGYLKVLWTDSDETWWTGWVCDHDELIRFWWRPGSGYDIYSIFKVILHHWEKGPKTICSMISQKVIGPDMFSWIRHYVAEVCALPSGLLV